MILDKRRAHLLSVLLQSSKPIHAKQLTENLGISKRTIYYDLDQINDWLASQSFDAIQNIHGQGFWLPESLKQQINLQEYNLTDEYVYQFSESERILLLIVRLLTEDTMLTMNSFIASIQMSRGTIVKDLKKVKEQLKAYELLLDYSRSKGYRVVGQEEDKRKLLSNAFSTIMLDSEWKTIREKIYTMLGPKEFLKNGYVPDKEKIIQFINQAENGLFLMLTDEMIEMLAIELLIIIKRVGSGQFVTIDQEEKNVLKETEHHKAANLIMKRLSEHFHVMIPPDEICFLTMNLLGLKVHRDDFSYYSKREKSGLRKVAQRMIADFQTYACVIFDDRGGLENNLIAHIKPTYYRLKYNVKTSGNLVSSIKENYSEIYHFTKRVVVHLEYYVGKSIPDEETAYIALHFGGWLKKENKQVDLKYKALIVCENGIGTSNMLKTQLEGLIAGLDVVAIQSMREFNLNRVNADVIFSTNYIKENEIPVIHVPAILSNTDKEQILQTVNDLFQSDYQEYDEAEHIIRVIENYATIHDRQNLIDAISKMNIEQRHQIKELKKPMLKELLTESTIQLEDHVSNWEEAIKVAAKPLVTQLSITQEYVQAMIDNVKELGPYVVIAPNIALPHARPEAGVQRLGMSLLRLKESVNFSDEEKHRAQLIIVLAAIDNQTHLKALSQLTEMLSDEENVQRLIDSANTDEVLDLINNY
ncbi:BglG family transcription antiterminator [Virgibacillus oceani]|uniref:Transcriptional antiterminator n=1 Tax=Virgibacillus oceani TaxID=1479511 RepID=A0A917M5H0_9BACI|nr:BglG family transcription antiterminator [Virgibacillus oceani]GGG79319.1 transcriptional antiterminator [Virgibacillus oceani]